MTDPLTEARNALHAVQQLLSHEDGPPPDEDMDVIDQAEEIARVTLARLDKLPAPTYLSAEEVDLEITLDPRPGWFYWDPEPTS